MWYGTTVPQKCFINLLCIETAAAVLMFWVSIVLAEDQMLKHQVINIHNTDMISQWDSVRKTYVSNGVTSFLH